MVHSLCVSLESAIVVKCSFITTAIQAYTGSVVDPGGPLWMVVVVVVATGSCGPCGRLDGDHCGLE